MTTLLAFLAGSGLTVAAMLLIWKKGREVCAHDCPLLLKARTDALNGTTAALEAHTKLAETRAENRELKIALAQKHRVPKTPPSRTPE